jgi:hypothetical protein
MIKFSKSEKVTFQLRQDLAERIPPENPERRNFLNTAVEHELDGRKAAAAIMGSAKSEKKAAACRENAKKPRPRITDNSIDSGKK